MIRTVANSAESACLLNDRFDVTFLFNRQAPVGARSDELTTDVIYQGGLEPMKTNCPLCGSDMQIPNQYKFGHIDFLYRTATLVWVKKNP